MDHVNKGTVPQDIRLDICLFMFSVLKLLILKDSRFVSFCFFHLDFIYGLIPFWVFSIGFDDRNCNSKLMSAATANLEKKRKRGQRNPPVLWSSCFRFAHNFNLTCTPQVHVEICCPHAFKVCCYGNYYSSLLPMSHIICHTNDAETCYFKHAAHTCSQSVAQHTSHLFWHDVHSYLKIIFEYTACTHMSQIWCSNNCCLITMLIFVSISWLHTFVIFLFIFSMLHTSYLQWYAVRTRQRMLIYIILFKMLSYICCSHLIILVTHMFLTYTKFNNDNNIPHVVHTCP